MGKNYLNKISILLHFVVLSILFFEAFKVIPPTEGWFIELTKDKNLGQILINDEILLPPIYPLFIWLVNKLSYQIIFLRFIGIIFGLCLYFESAKLIKKGTLLINSSASDGNEIRLLSFFYSFLLIYFISKISTYLLWYDFTILILLLQIHITNLLLIDPKQNFYSKRIYKYIGILLIVGVFIKHSNMGIFLISINFGLIIDLVFNHSNRKNIFIVFRYQICALFLILFIIFGYLIYIDKVNLAFDFVSASSGAKGGFDNIKSFLLNGLEHIYIQIKSLDTLFLSFLMFLILKNKKLNLDILIFSFSFILSLSIFQNNYNLGAFSIKSLSILLITCIFVLFEIIFIFFKKNINDGYSSKYIKLIFLPLSSVGCLLGNFTSAGLGYNGYFIGLIIGIIFQNIFLIQILGIFKSKIIKT